MINLFQISRRLRTIRFYAPHDYETCHFEEDKLYVEVLKTIANDKCADGETPQQLAKRALRAQKITFKRVCA